VDLPNTVGVFIVLELFAVPFGYEGASAIMNRQWGRAFTAYLLGLPIAVGGLLVIGVPVLGSHLTGAVGGSLFGFLKPLSNPYFVVALLIGVLVWLHSTGRVKVSPKVASAPSPQHILAPIQEKLPVGVGTKEASDGTPKIASLPKKQPEPEVRRQPDAPLGDPELAARCFNRFNPPRPMIDLTNREWIELGMLYSIHVRRGNDGGKAWENRYLTLLFLPDSRPVEQFALLMLMYGWLKIYGYSKVTAHYLEEGLYQSGVRQERTGFDRLITPIFLNDDRLIIDDVAKSHAIDGLISEKMGLAKGGYYTLTEQGTKRAADMYVDLIRRAS
jgi:hypothetical protein